MSGYREWPAILPGAVLWTRGTLRIGAAARILPDGCLDLIRSPQGLMVAGPDTVAQLVPPSRDAEGGAPDYVGLRLPPGVGPAVLGVPAHELRDRRVPLADVWGDGPACRIWEGLADAPTKEVGTALDRLAAVRLQVAHDERRAVRPDPAALHLVGLLQRGSGVAEAAGVLGLSERQLHRRCLIAFGYGAKTLDRILRLIRALDCSRSGMPPAQAAAVAGYADQPHLARDVRALTGVTLRTLLTEP